MSESEQNRNGLPRIVKYGFAVAVAGAVGALVYAWWGGNLAGDQPPAGESKTLLVSPRKKSPPVVETKADVAPAPGSKKIDLVKASRDDVVNLLRDVTKVQRDLTQLMDSVVRELLLEKLGIGEAYAMLSELQPEDPLDTYGLSIADFDSLLERFSCDSEVHVMILEVIQGPEQVPPITRDGTERNRAFELSPERIIEINGAMRDRLRVAAQQIRNMALDRSLPGPYKPRTASLTAQAVVGAYVQKEFRCTADEIERAMQIHMFELSRRELFISINEDIQTTMHEFVLFSPT